ncbi:MAG: hypothetical protein GY817_09330 [bacterium]|nr:hypothetical protein [bacterium]
MKEGYVFVIVDLRGTGASEGSVKDILTTFKDLCTTKVSFLMLKKNL